MKDESLLEQFLATGGLPYFRTIYDRHAPAIASFVARKYLDGNDEKAAKVTEWAFARLLNHPELFDRRYKLRPWLFSIAAKRAIKFRQAISIVAICQRHGVLPCDHRGMVKLVRKGGKICHGLGSRLSRPNYRACLDELCEMLTNA